MALPAIHRLLISLLIQSSIAIAISEDAAEDHAHARAEREAEIQTGSQIVQTSYGDVVNGPPSATPNKIKIKPSRWRFLDLLPIVGSFPHSYEEALSQQETWHSLASILIHHTFIADKIVQYQLSRLLGTGGTATYFPYYINHKGQLVAALNGSIPEDIFQSVGFMIVGSPCLTGSHRGHVPALLMTIPDMGAPILQVNQETVKLDYVGELIAGEDSAVHENRTDYSYMDLLLGSNIDKRSIQVQIEQDMVVEENCTSNCPITTTELTTSTTEMPTTTEDTTTTEISSSTFESSTVSETTSEITTTPFTTDTTTTTFTSNDTVTTTEQTTTTEVSTTGEETTTTETTTLSNTPESSDVTTLSPSVTDASTTSTVTSDVSIFVVDLGSVVV
ncbi:hypothetical protein C7M84_007723 [Penaeus vannamei]|uniref:Uncharacterized protein n=1 Tax=Penaeus vannamei TaxID=6689 RepID=A0A3R7PQC9_PENVA|nr:hypothetical protein C7M84_007723 [Penaeus vannamei]